MAYIIADRVAETTTGTGTGNLTLTGVLGTSYKVFSAVCANNDVFPGLIIAVDGSGNPAGEWETGVYTWTTGGIIQRTAIKESSNANAAVNFSAGTKRVYLSSIADQSPYFVEDGSLLLPMPSVSSPGIPPANTIKLFPRKIANRLLPAFVGPAGIDSSLQPNFARNKIAICYPIGNSTSLTTLGIGSFTATGTATAAAVAQTNMHQMQKRVDYLVTTAAATAVAGWRQTSNQWSIGHPSNPVLGGFHNVVRFGQATGVATTTHRLFVGMGAATAAPTDVEPSTITNIIGVGYDAADTNLQIMHRGAGAVTKIDLGANFPVPTADRSKSYELALFSPPGTTQAVHYEFTDMDTGNVATGTIATNLPAASQLLSPRGWMSVGGTSSVIGIALMSFYIETDY